MPLMQNIEKLFKNTKNKILSIGTPSKEQVLYAELTTVVNKKDAFWNRYVQKEKIAKEEQAKKLKTTIIEEKIEIQRREDKVVEAKKLKTKKVESIEAEGIEAERIEVKKVTSTLSKKDIKIALYHEDILKHYGEVDSDFLALIVKNLGPAIYRKNTEFVSCYKPKELDNVRKNFLIRKLGLYESKEVLDTTIQEVCQELKGVQQKYRATFYYRLAKKLNKELALS